MALQTIDYAKVQIDVIGIEEKERESVYNSKRHSHTTHTHTHTHTHTQIRESKRAREQGTRLVRAQLCLLYTTRS